MPSERRTRLPAPSAPIKISAPYRLGFAGGDPPECGGDAALVLDRFDPLGAVD